MNGPAIVMLMTPLYYISEQVYDRNGDEYCECEVWEASTGNRCFTHGSWNHREARRSAALAVKQLTEQKLQELAVRGEAQLNPTNATK